MYFDYGYSHLSKRFCPLQKSISIVRIRHIIDSYFVVTVILSEYNVYGILN